MINAIEMGELAVPSIRVLIGVILPRLACSPVIISNQASMPEVAGDAAQLANPFSSISIGEAIESLEADDSLRRKLREAGQERVKRFQWTGMR